MKLTTAITLISCVHFCVLGNDVKRILVDDKDFVQSQLHQLSLDIQDLKTKLAEKDIHLVQLQNVVHGFADRLNQKDQQVEALQTALQEKTSQIANISNQMTQLQSKVMVLESDGTRVAFYAHLHTNLALSGMKPHQTIIYDTVDTNVGNAYNKANGWFTAPSAGVYVFSIVTGSGDRSHASVELVINDVVRDVTWADSMDHDDRAVATSSTPVNLKAGDIVKARIGSALGGSIMETDANIRCSFSGFKL